MKIDTLVLGGASSKAPVYIGIFNFLFESGFLTEDLQGIHHIITCSIGMLYAIYLLLGVNTRVQETATIKADFTKFLDIDNIDINDLLFNLGLFDTALVPSLIKGVLKEKYSREDMTLKELYELKPILLTVKCINVTKGSNEYINYKTDPDISILQLLEMTTAIPLFFKPIEYKGDLYVDGGLTGGYPVELVKDNYLGFNIIGPADTGNVIDILPIISYMINLLKVKVLDYNKLSPEFTIQYQTDVPFYNFDIAVDKKKELIQIGYDITKSHMEQYKLTNESVNKIHPEDKDPTEED